MTRTWGDIVSIIFTTKNQPFPSLTFYTNVRLALFRPIQCPLLNSRMIGFYLLRKQCFLLLVVVVVGFKSSCDNYHSSLWSRLTLGERSHQQ